VWAGLGIRSKFDRECFDTTKRLSFTVDHPDLSSELLIPVGFPSASLQTLNCCLNFHVDLSIPPSVKRQRTNADTSRNLAVKKSPRGSDSVFPATLKNGKRIMPLEAGQRSTPVYDSLPSKSASMRKKPLALVASDPDNKVAVRRSKRVAYKKAVDERNRRLDQLTEINSDTTFRMVDAALHLIFIGRETSGPYEINRRTSGGIPALANLLPGVFNTGYLRVLV
jgi:hypothetical protein